MNILVTGGAGYIGSHTVQALLADADKIVVYDSLVTGHVDAVPAEAEKVQFVLGDIADTELLESVLHEEKIDAVVHFAAASLVGESMKNPAYYYQNNVAGTLSLLNALVAAKVKKIVFSSTAAVYGEPEAVPILETAKQAPTNVYGRTKLVIEGMLADYEAAYGLKYAVLRYFNAAGALEGGFIGEDHATETHLIPLILKTALGQREAISVFGTDYPTPDGTCIRDYVHVTDLADAHVLALRHLLAGGASAVYNLGSEHGFSVKEIIAVAKEVTGVDFPVKEAARRAGDPAVLVASSAKIRAELGWQPQHSSVQEIVASAWEWHQAYPDGYGDE
ncbi:MAG: UDP-glucose 4-epimerase GalE [Sporomusaceae bacterium]|nr:UDP-glucose 4-epimerase GalE [Sporomusaceae bacterium]